LAWRCSTRARGRVRRRWQRRRHGRASGPRRPRCLTRTWKERRNELQAVPDRRGRRGLDETYKEEGWAKDFPGKAYYDVHLSTIEKHEMATPTFREYLGQGGMKILESGCGTGRWMAYFEKLRNRSFGVDDSWGPLRMARAHDPNMNLVRANALLTPYKNDSFDAAFSSYVAEHFEEGPETLFREIHRVLKPGGLFFVVVPYNNTFRRRRESDSHGLLDAVEMARPRARVHRVPLHAGRDGGLPAPHRLRHR
jgi:SAM-dependent methyltransferase